MADHVLFFPDGAFAAPRIVMKRDWYHVPDEWRDLYALGKTNRDGRMVPCYVMRAPAWAQFESIVTDANERLSQHAAFQAKHERHTEARARQEARINSRMIDSAVGKLLVFAGVKEPLLHGATALLRDAHKLVVDETDGEFNIFAESEYGMRELTEVVEEFLTTNAAAPYMKGGALQKQPAPHFANMLKH
ncbi:MAG: hypothetical protein JNK47_03965 [Mesorhizobium sp.]|nr:hypothetical protein [Mesorhizobium sp.]MBL8576358.1 hypothetical protein [Mesorhizobium sp.]